MRRAALILVGLAIGAVAVLYFRLTREVPLPPDVGGTLLYLSDRGGADTLYARALPEGAERRLTYFTEAVREPALSPDGSRVAFSVGGRIGVVSLATGDVRLWTYGIDYRDSQPAWRAAGQALAVAARRPGETFADVPLLAPLATTGGRTGRTPITLTRGLDESAPAMAPDGSFVVFVREDNLVRQELGSGRTRRLTGGFRKTRQPLFLPGGRILCLWALEKEFGIDVMDGDGRHRVTLNQGTTYYRTLAASPDGRFFAATFSFDLRFHPIDALRPRHVEEVHLLDAHGAFLAPLARAFRDSNHSPQWAR
jgi:Tol biopolymer transport system component